MPDFEDRICLHDSHGRAIDYLRISLTDRCNLRCVYCMPEEGVPSLRRDDILSLEEIETIVALAAENGIKHIRLTGGEPLVRKNIVKLIDRITHIEGIESVALTTNGILLPAMAHDLKRAGLSRVNISLDSLDANQYRAITRCGNLNDALAGIDAALENGFDPVKINVVVVRHLEQDLARFARLTLDRPLHVRFIEYMPVGNIDGGSSAPTASENNADHVPWSDQDVVAAVEIKSRLNATLVKEGEGELIPLGTASNSDQAPVGWGPATYCQIKGAQGTIGFISALSNHFCATCNRIRLTADGKLRPCLFSDEELDLKRALRANDITELQRTFDKALSIKPEGHHHHKGTRRSMSQMGG